MRLELELLGVPPKYLPLQDFAGECDRYAIATPSGRLCTGLESCFMSGRVGATLVVARWGVTSSCSLAFSLSFASKVLQAGILLCDPGHTRNFLLYFRMQAQE